MKQNKNPKSPIKAKKKYASTPEEVWQILGEFAETQKSTKEGR